MSEADQTRASDAAAAFDGLRQEVKLLRMAVGAWVDQQPAPPDYTETLGKIAEDLSRTGRKVAWVAQRPALALSPNEMAHAIKIAGEDARTTDRKLILEGAAGLQRAADDLSGWMVQARTAELQKRRLLQVGSIAGALGLLVGLLLPLAVSGSDHPGRPPQTHHMSSASAGRERRFALGEITDLRPDAEHGSRPLAEGPLWGDRRLLSLSPLALAYLMCKIPCFRFAHS